MMVTIHQPCYIPYLGIFHKIWKADVFVYLDDAQYSNGYVFDWNRIKTPQGECRLKVPLEKKFGQSLMEVQPKDFLGWKAKHLKMIESNYKRAQYFDDFYSVFERTIKPEFESLAGLNVAVMNMLLAWFDIKKPIYYAHQWGLESRSEERVIDIIKKVGADAYFSGSGGKLYQKEDHFTEEGIRLIYQNWEPTPYRQQWGEFRPYMSAIDFAMNEGHDLDGHFIRMEESFNGR